FDCPFENGRAEGTLDCGGSTHPFDPLHFLVKEQSKAAPSPSTDRQSKTIRPGRKLMSGIIGYIGNKRVVPVLLEGLQRLQYRGYDSAGLAVMKDGTLEVRRARGKLRNLEEVIRLDPLEGTYGIGHTRWATHGAPTEENAHPHRDCHGSVAVVHNGIIENYEELKKQLEAEGHKFRTETDTEVIAHLIERYLNRGTADLAPTSGDALAAARPTSLEEAVRAAVHELTGVFALAIISTRDRNKIV